MKSSIALYDLRNSLAATLLLALAACGADRNPDMPGEASAKAMTAADFRDQVPLSNAEYLSTAPYSTADRRFGERIAMQCRACHTLEAGGATLLGPNIHRLFGRPAAASDEFTYSPALSGAGIVWTPAALDAWLAEPSRFLPGNRMAFAGIRDPADRDALIAYLLVATDSTIAGAANDE